MIIPILIPLIGLVVTVFTVFQLARNRSEVAEEIRLRVEKRKAEMLAADREADQRLLMALGNSDQPEKTIKSFLDHRAIVVPVRTENPEEWTKEDLLCWLERERTRETLLVIGPLKTKALKVIFLTLVVAISGVLVWLKINDWMTRSVPDQTIPSLNDSASQQLTRSQGFPDSFFSSGGSSK